MKSFRLITYLLLFSCGFNSMPAICSGDFQFIEKMHYEASLPVWENASESAASILPIGDQDMGKGSNAENSPAPENSCYILMQLSNSNAVCNGQKIKLKSGFGLPVMPHYFDDLSIIPLRIIAEMFDCSVTWDALSRKVTISGKETDTVFSVGDSYAEQNGQTIALNAPVVMKNDTVYVPARAFCRTLGCYIHYFDKSDGEYLLISDFPISTGDLAGGKTANDSFSDLTPDINLLSYRQIGTEYLGPSRSMYSSQTLFLRCGSTHSIQNGTDTLITVPGSGPLAPIKTADGNIFVPLEYCAQSFGAQTQTTSGGDLSIICEGKASVFPLVSGYYIQNGIKKADNNYVTLIFDGVVFTTVQAVATALDIYYSYYDSEILSLSTYNPDDHEIFEYYNAVESAKLLLQPTIKGYIALTFDDGPSGGLTARLLDGFAERSVHVTFFLCNYRIVQYPELMNRYISEGHEVGNHSASHSTLTYLSGRELEAEIDTTNETIKQYLGVSPHLFRPPGGSYNQRVLSALDDRSMSCIMWSVDPKDWHCRNSRTVVTRVLSCAKDGAVILMHDMFNSSVDAGLEIIDILKGEGYKFVTVSDLAFIKGYDLTSGQVYRCFP